MEYKKETLNNGIRLITVPMPNLESVTVMIGIGAGSRYEEARVQGLAHFTEHMMFKGTKRRPTALEINTELDSLGAQHNAFTAKELTGYFVKAAEKHLPKILDVLADTVFNSKFDPKDIDVERGVILEELRMYRDDPKMWIALLSNKLVFGDHPLGWEVLGKEETLKSIRREDFLDYLEHWYHPENVVVAIAGKLREEALWELRKFLGGLPRSRVKMPVKYEAQQAAPGILLEERKIDQTHFILSLRTFAREHPNREKLEVLSAILGVGMSSRLFQEVRERRGLAYYIEAEWDDFSDTGVLDIATGVNNARLEEALKVILEELRKIKEELIPAAELQKAKELIRGHLVLGLESTSGAAAYFLEQEVLERKIETPEEVMKKIDAVTAEDVRQVAKELFINQGLNLSLIGPFSDPEKFRPLLKI